MSTESSQSSLDDISESQPLEEPFQEDDIEKQLFSQPEVEEPSLPPTLEDHATSSQPSHSAVTETNDDALSLDTRKPISINGSIVVDQPPVRCISSTDVKTPLHSLPTMQVPKPAESQVSIVTEPSLTGDSSLNSSGFTITHNLFKRSIDPLRNKHICFVGKDDKVPDLPRSTTYVFSSYLTVDCSGDMGETTTQVDVGEPTVADFFLTASNMDDFKTALSKLQELQNNQDVQVSYLYLENCIDDDDNVDPLTMNALKLSKNVKQLVIKNCKFSKPVYERIIGQLTCSQKLELLHLEQVNAFPEEFSRSFSKMHSLKKLHLHQCQLKPEMFRAAAQDLLICKKLVAFNLSRTTDIPVEVGAALKMMTRLKTLKTRQCQMTAPVCESVAKGLSICQAIEHIDLSGNTLTNCVIYLLSGNKFSELKVLLLDNAELSADDLKSIAKAVSNGYIRKLNHLKLSGNNLAGCIQNLFNEDDFPQFQALQWLQIDGTNINKSDVNCIAKAAEDGQLPLLRVLDASDNSIKSNAVDLLGDDNHTGYKNLEKLILKNVGLAESNKKDIGKISALINDKKLPKLRSLSLSENNLTNMYKNLFGELNHTGLQRLYLQKTNLNREDVKSLSRVFQEQQLPNLQELTLSHNTLKGYVGELFNTEKKGGFQLRRLYMKNSH